MHIQCWFPRIVAVLVILVSFHIRCQCQTLNDTKQLLNDLLEDYNKNIRPVENQSRPVVVYASFNLMSIIDVDEVRQAITINAFFAFYWTDESITWKPEEYGGLSYFTSQNEKFWTPPIVLMTTSDTHKKLGEPWVTIRYSADGLSHFFPSDVFISACVMDITNFPYDQHECLLEFVPLGYRLEDLEIENLLNKASLSDFTENGVWELVDTEISVSKSSYSSFIVKVIIKRSSRFVVMNIFVPLMFFSILNVFVFFIPIDSGERISFCITLLLAIAVFLTIVGEYLPKTSHPMSIFSYYLFGVLIMSNCITLATIFNLTLFYHDDSKPVPYYWRMVVKAMKCKLLCLRKRNKTSSNTTMPTIIDENRVHPIGDVLETDQSNCDTEKRRRTEIGTLKPNLDDGTSVNTPPDISWKDVSSSFDTLAFFVFSSILAIITSVLFFFIRQ